MTLRIRGVHYDVGQQYAGEGSGTTRPSFERGEVEADMAMIAGRLHANTVRIAGTDLSRLAVAADAALDAGLAVWFSPHPGEMVGDEIVDYLAEAARIAERLRAPAGAVTMVAGCELSLFCGGFLPGATLTDRLAALTSPPPSTDLAACFRALPRLLDATLSRSVGAIRDRFHGHVTYASAPWEVVDWASFDVVSVDLYRDSSNAAGYRDQLRSYLRIGKPVVVSEFGCCTYKGAADAGGAGFDVLEYDGQPPAWRLKSADLERSEGEQSRYLRALLTVFDEEGIDGAFWHTFAGWTLPHRANPAIDLDLGSFGLVKIVEADPDGTDSHEFARQPKESFGAMAAAYRRMDRG